MCQYVMRTLGNLLQTEQTMSTSEMAKIPHNTRITHPFITHLILNETKSDLHI